METQIGRYAIKKKLGKGGMGEVFLVLDPISQREVALKMIREDLQNNRSVQDKFLNEALIASQLSHPSIIPVYEIHQEATRTYYTMPYIEGETLNQILDPLNEASIHPIRDSIPALMGVFLQICQGIAYTHAKNIFHRDLKPDNILIGRYGEVLIFDWGIAERKEQQKERPLHPPPRVAGTLAYMAPERAFGEKASPITEIYSLGCILYKILTLRPPFHRKSLFHFRRDQTKEQLVDPVELAPYREIPHQLSSIVKKCLAKPEERYNDVLSLIQEIKGYIEGRSEWLLLENLVIDRPADWRFQENILVAKHIAISKQIDISEWVGIMISKNSFSGNLCIEAEVLITEESHGIGLLLDIPAPQPGRLLEEGYCLWLGSKKAPSSQLFRSNILVVNLGALYLPSGQWQKVRFEKVQDHLYFFLNGKLIFSYTSHLPLPGDHVGILHRDGSFVIKEFKVFSGSHNVMINCLTLPDAFLARKDYKTALIEYRKIGHSFPGRAEGREALFRAGLTLLEEAKHAQEQEKETLFQEALDEFENLRHTPGAPLEYLGKSLVYKDLNESSEEAKCLELAIRKYPKHPLLSLLEEQITYRLHQSALEDKKACYQLLLLVLLQLPKVAKMEETLKLIDSLKKNWEKLPFIQEKAHIEVEQDHLLTIQLSFWLSKDRFLLELYNQLKSAPPLPKSLLENILFALLEIGKGEALLEVIEDTTPFSLLLKEVVAFDRTCKRFTLGDLPFLFKESLANFKAKLPHDRRLTFQELTCIYLILQISLDHLLPIEEFILSLESLHLPKHHSLAIYRIWSNLLQDKIDEATHLLSHYNTEALEKESSPLYFIYGCYLFRTQTKTHAYQHFHNSLLNANPHSCALLSHFLHGRLDRVWWHQAFFYEKRALYRELTLYYHCLGDSEKKQHYHKLSLRGIDHEER